MTSNTPHRTIVVLVENKAGVLARVADLFARRGYNIVSLAVAPTNDVRFSYLVCFAYSSHYHSVCCISPII